jgi:alpha-N-arabinofuranosidase
MSRFENPILSGFHPDPSICRVGSDYYLVNSSFEYFPGIPVFHSRDLVNWRRIGHVIERKSQAELSNATPSGGIFAPTIRYHDGLFYLITTNVTARGNIVLTAADPAGPWSDPLTIEGAPGIDPSLFFDDDGSCWYVGNGDPVRSLYEGHHTIWLQRFDVATMRLVGERVVIVDGGTDIAKKPIWIEGPHLYKIDGRYYLVAAEGGTGDNHSVVVFRGAEIQGPYESYAGNPILTNAGLDPDRPNPITCTGHADLFETQNGQWWMVLLACRPYPPGDRYYNMGRETFLVPMTWSEGWPVTEDGTGRLHGAYDAPNLAPHPWRDGYGLGNFSVRDEFDSPVLGTDWTMIRTPTGRWHDLEARPGYLRLHARKEAIARDGCPSFLGLRQRHNAFTATTVVEICSGNADIEAGLAIVQNNRASYELLVARQSGETTVRLYKRAAGDASASRRGQANVSGSRVYLRIDAQGAALDFLFSECGERWSLLASGEDARILSINAAGGFVGAFVGLYAHARGASDSPHADFDWFEYRGAEASRHPSAIALEDFAAVGRQ